MNARMIRSATLSPRRAPAPAASQSVRIAAIDVGSNSVHMIICQVEPDGGMVPLFRMKEMIGLAAAAFPSRSLPPAAMDHAIAVLARFKQTAMGRGCEKIRCVATSAVRESSNGGDLLQRIGDELGLSARVISGREEARLIYLGVRHAAHLHANTLLVDVGGGSVEFIIGDEEQASLLESRKLGASRMTTQFVKSDPISEADLAALRRHYDKELSPLCEQLLAAKFTRAIGTSGTLETLAAMSHAIPGGSNGSRSSAGTVLERGAFNQLLDKLVKSTAAERGRMAALDPRRRDQIVAGAVLVGELFRRLRLRKIELCKSALREGVLVDYVARHIPELTIRQRIGDPRRRSVLALARRCAWHKIHSEQVAKLCVRLFDQLRSLHGLDPRARELIEFGALLHDIGWHISQEGHHKHSMYLIANGNLEGFTEEEIQIIANIARYHRKSPPRKKHPVYQRLTPSAKRIVDIGASLLRLADGLDRSHGGVVEDLRCRTTAAHVKCSVVTRDDAQLEVWGANRKREMFESVFERPIVFELTKP